MDLVCCLPSLTEIKVDGQPDVGVRYDPGELLPFLARDFGPSNALCERAEMFEDRIYKRTREVFEYFDLPFETAQPPDLPRLGRGESRGITSLNNLAVVHSFCRSRGAQSIAARDK